MKLDTRPSIFACFVAIVMLASGCATVVKGKSQTLTVTTDPEGATCTMSRKGEVIGAINPTPGSLQVDKSSMDLELNCRKQGYLDTESRIDATVQGWTFGNIILGGIIGVVVDAGSGAMHEYRSTIEIKLVPEAFPTAEKRDAFFEEQRAEVESNAKLKQAEKDALLAELDTTKQRTRISGDGELAAAAPPSAPVVQTAATAQSISPDPEMAAGGPFKPGDQWKYRLSDGRRTIATIVIKIADVNGTRIKERITREGTTSFIAERDVDGSFSPTHFLDPITLPGGYQLAEIAPYFPPGTEIKIGQTWKGVPGEFQILELGKKKLVADVKVMGQENVKVPAGSFKAWKIVADVEEDTGGGGNRIKPLCTFWYSSESLRTIKMSISYLSGHHTFSSIEVYELIAMEAGR